MLTETWKDGRARISAECAAAMQVSPAGAAKTDTHSLVKHPAPHRPSHTTGGPPQTIQNGPQRHPRSRLPPCANVHRRHLCARENLTRRHPK